MTFVIHHGDCMAVLRTMPDNSVDSIVTDPPYGLSFMGKRWDYDVPAVEVWAECLRVLKPGGYLLAFAGTRTQHRMAVRIEDAGLEIRDMIAWVYGSGFPKSHNGEWGGTALKPALEPITMARKPLAGTVEANWREHGTGALNIDGCRVGSEGGTAKANIRKGEPNGERAGSSMGENISFRCDTAKLDAGRWPANLIHDGSEEVVASFPSEAVAAAPVHKRNGDKFRNSYGSFAGNIDEAGSTFRGDKGSAARFFYCAKASRKDRNEGCEHMAAKPLHWSSGSQNPGSFQSEGTDKTSQNNHPTVKPTDLMRYLCRLVTPPGGTVLDPFAGSGSTGKAAVREGFRFVGIEREAEYVEIARARIDFAVKGNDIPQGDLFEVNP